MAEEKEDPCLQEVRELRKIIGTFPDENGSGGSGIAGEVHSLKMTVGRAPNKATNEIGAGMAMVVAGLAEAAEEKAASWWGRVFTPGKSAIATIVAFVLIEILTRFGVIPPPPHQHEAPPVPAVYSAK